MAEGQGEALVTIGEIAQGHGDIQGAVAASRRGAVGRLLAGWRDEMDDAVTRRPYSAALTALAAGLLGGMAIAASRRWRPPSRGW